MSLFLLLFSEESIDQRTSSFFFFFFLENNLFYLISLFYLVLLFERLLQVVWSIVSDSCCPMLVRGKLYCKGKARTVGSNVMALFEINTILYASIV